MGNTKGFTLIEFLIALVVVGFIVSLLTGYFGSPLNQASISRAATEIVQETTALANGSNVYYIKKNSWPATFDDLRSEGVTDVDVSAKTYAGGPLDGSAFYPNPVDVNLGDGTVKKMVVFSMPLWEPTTAVCKKINEHLLGLSVTANIPDTSGGTVSSWGSRPAETVGQGAFCVKTSANFYDVYMALL